MPAIITQDFRKYNTKNFMDKLLGDIPDRRYYMGIGKPNPWHTPQFMPMPTSGPSATRDVKDNLIATKAIRTGLGDSDVTFGRMIPNIKYVQGYKYKFYDSTDDSCWYPTVNSANVITHWPCYVVKDGSVWLILRNRPSTVFNESLEAPDEYVAATPTSTPFETTNGIFAEPASGYIYGKFCDLGDTGRFLDTSEFVQIDDCTPITLPLDAMPVWSKGIYSGKVNDKFIDKLGGVFDDESGAKVSATDRVVFNEFNDMPDNTVQAYSYDFANSVISVTYKESNGDDALTPVTNIDFSTGSLTHVSVSSKYTTPEHPYEFVDISFSTLPDYAGIGTQDIIDFLPSWYIGFNSQISTANGEVPTDLAYRQISILSVANSDVSSVIDTTRGALASTNDDEFVSDALTIIELNYEPDGVNTALSSGDIIYGANDSRAVFVEYFNDDGPKIKVVQNSETGLRPLTGALTYGSLRDPRRLVNGANNVEAQIQYAPEFVADEKVDVLFIENTAPLTRNAIQIEDLKVIIQF